MTMAKKRGPYEMPMKAILVPACLLWGRSAGRCEFEGRNRPVSYHPRTKETGNLAEDIITNLRGALTSFQEIANGLEE